MIASGASLRKGLGFLAPSLFALLLGSPLRARADVVDAYVRAVMRDLHVPGLSLAVVREGKLVKAQGYGLASLELRRPVTEDPLRFSKWWFFSWR